MTDAVIQKVGAAVGHVVTIQQDFSQRLQAAQTTEERVELADEAKRAATKAIGEQGVSVDEYNRVVAAAEENPEMEARLLTAVRAAGWDLT